MNEHAELHQLYFIFSHLPLLVIVVIIIRGCSAFMQRKGLQPVLKLSELRLQITYVQLSTNTQDNNVLLPTGNLLYICLLVGHHQI